LARNSGFIGSILEEGTLPKMNAFVVGAGGAARAALYALGTFNFDTIFLTNRTMSK